jgi:hypothetical protein
VPFSPPRLTPAMQADQVNVLFKFEGDNCRVPLN